MKTSPPVVVVVNDDLTQLNVLAGLLRKAGVVPRTFTGADAALRDMRAGSAEEGAGSLPALIVTDLHMSGIDGWHFCRLLRSPEYAAFNDIPILVVSATFSGAETARIATDLGAEAFLSWPVDGRRFCTQVQAILNGEHTHNSLRVLLVDDNVALCELMKATFASHGYVADAALTIQEATEALATTVYDVAVLDYHLPDGSGDTLLDTLRLRQPECVCLMITSDPQPELALAWMKKGAAAYLRKPFQTGYLIELCARARRERALMRVQDILEIRTRELRESEAKHRILLEESPDPFFSVTRDGQYTYANPACAKVLGKPVADIVGHSLWEVSGKREADERFAHLSQVIHTGREKLFEECVPRSDGERYYLTVITPIQDETKGVVSVISSSKDITDRRRAEQEKVRLGTQLQRAQKLEALGQLASGVAHDFNNVLQAMQGNLDLALEDIPPGSPGRDNLVEIQKYSQQAAALTRQLLAFGRRQIIEPKVFKLNEAVENILKMLRRLIGEDIHLDWQPGANPGLVRIDPTQFDQLLTNLCINARQAIKGVGKISILTTATVFDEAYCADHPDFQVGAFVRLTVSDDGCGMDPQSLGHIFEPFFSAKGVGEGSGLGLATVYGIVKQNQGFIHVQSEPGKGATFQIYLPQITDHTAAERPSPSIGTVHSPGGVVLLVEDELSILALTQRVLQRLGYTVLSTCSPGEAIRLAEAHSGKIDLLLVDVVMPEMNGQQLSKQILSLQPNLKCLFMSGYTADVVARHGVHGEGSNFIQKPFSQDDLSAQIRSLLGSPTEN